MSDRTRYSVSEGKGCVFLRLEEGPKELKVFVSITSARDLARKLWGAAAAAEEQVALAAELKARVS